MPSVLVINKSGKRPTKSCPRRCVDLMVSLVYKVLFAAARFVLSLYYKEDKNPLPPIKDPLLIESAFVQAKKIRTQQISSVDLLKAYIQRIDDINSFLNCFVENRFEDALKEAKEADDLIKSGSVSEEQLAKEKPLLGVPFTTKDCIMVKGLHHTSGLITRKNIVGKEDSESIGHLRKAGAIPLGLTNVSELCMWWESHNKVHGRTNNPYDTTRIVGGSSGGEGCMQAAIGSSFGIGSDIGGSIRMPAFFNGIFGHKPSKFVVSNHGQYPDPVSEFQESFLGLGPMARKATDLKPLLKIITGDKAGQLNLDRKVDLSNIKVYYQHDCLNKKNVCPVDPAIRQALNNAVSHFKSVSDTTPQEVKFEKFEIATKIWLASMNIKDSISFMERMTGSNNTLNVVIEIVKTLFGISKHTFIGLMTCLIEKTGPQPGSKKHNEMLRLRQDLEDEFNQLLGDDGVFLYPTHPTAAPYHNEPLLRMFNFNYTAIINVLGFPATHIPMGIDDEGLPVGIQVISNWNNDRLCLAVAEELEKQFGGWVDPSSTKKNV